MAKEREVVAELGSHDITRVWALAAALADGADAEALLGAFGEALSLYMAVVEKLENGELAGEDEETNRIYPIELERDGGRETLRILSVEREPEPAAARLDAGGLVTPAREGKDKAKGKKDEGKKDEGKKKKK